MSLYQQRSMTREDDIIMMSLVSSILIECLSFVFTQLSCQESVGSLEYFVPQPP